MNYSVTYKNFDTAINAARMFELRKLVSISVMEGNFRNARVAQREFAKAAVEDFDTLKTLPYITFTNVPLREWLVMGFRSLEYKFYKFFTGKSKEEKLLSKMLKTIKK
ncbi:MAG: hypothetical protein K6A44_02535 [bacterium]|nr:hypothetical protein [bacterium]